MPPRRPRHGRRPWLAHAPIALALLATLTPRPGVPVAQAAPARAERPAGGDVDLPVAVFKLDNGLTVLLHEDHAAPVVSVNIWYAVGSKDEKPGRTGFAHLFEHLMFQGSAHVGDDQHLSLIAQAGGAANATTSEDRTNFFETLPSNYLELALYLESDRMGFLVQALTQDKLDTQRGVVQNERRQSFENRPYGMSQLAEREALYPPGHPYHHATIGSHADLEAATLDDVKEFFRTYYTPGNAVLCIAGDIDPARARELVTRYFGPLPSRAPGDKAKAEPVVLPADKRVQLTDKVSFDRVDRIWPSPRWFAPGDAELDLLAAVLGGKGGRLYKRLVYEQRIAQMVVVMQASAKLGSEFHIVATAQPGHTAAEVEAALDAEVARLLKDAPITDDELTRARTAWEAQFVYGLEGIEHRADLINGYYDQFGEPGGFERDRARYVGATREAVMKAARDLLTMHHLTMVVVPEAPAPGAAKASGTAVTRPATSSKKGAR